MKRRRTRLLSILLTAVMVLTMVPMTAFATDETSNVVAQIESTDVGLEGNSIDKDSVNEEGNNSAAVNEAQIVTADGTNYYADAQDAINAATDGQTVTLLQDVAGGFSINEKTNLTVDCNGHTVGSVNFGNGNNGVTLQKANFVQTSENAVDVNGFDNQNITISDCTFTLNDVAGPWAAIYVQKTSSNLVIERNTFNINRAEPKEFQCIGFAYTDDMRTSDVIIRDNTMTATHSEGYSYFVLGSKDATDEEGNKEYGITNLEIIGNVITYPNDIDKDQYVTLLGNIDGLLVTGNTFNDCQVGVFLNSTGGLPTRNIFISGNNGDATYTACLYGNQSMTGKLETDVPGDKLLINGDTRLSFLKVTFDANGGSCDIGTRVLSRTDETGTAIGELPVPTRSGYSFLGWYTEASGGEEVTAETKITEDTPLYAHWSRNSSSGGGTSSGNKTETVTNPDGSTTTTVTKPDGSTTETTKNPDGSQEVVETSKDGTVTTTTTDKEGNKTEVVENTDDSSLTTVENKDGSSSVTTTADGKTESKVEIPQSVIDTAAEDKTAVVLPMPEVSASKDKEAAAEVTVNLPEGTSAKVEVPVKDVTSGTVAVLVKEDGTEEVIKTSLTTENGVAVTVSDGDTIKIVDNSKEFSDVDSEYWGADTIDFATSRELFNGTSETTFSPENDMTRAMIVTVLARYEGVDTSAGDNWYEAGAQWAVENGVSDGTNLDNSVTREQLVTMLYRYAGEPEVTGALGDFTDKDSVSDWASSAMIWAVDQGLIDGMGDGSLNPQGNATRAQVAAILTRFVKATN